MKKKTKKEETEAKEVKLEVKKYRGRKVSPSKQDHYVDKQELLNEIILSQKNKMITDKLSEMFTKMIEGVARRFSNLQYYGIYDDVKQDCHLLLLQKFQNFKSDLNTSCFAYFTTVIYNQMRYQLTKAKRYRDKKEAMTNTVIDYIESHRHELIGEDDDY
jgi:DNA-directed RNA polymerase specialized sigma24 family protein